MLAEISAIRVESVIAKLPLHTLSAQGTMNVQIEKRGPNGEVTLLWKVSASRNYGEPRYLAYRLDTLVVNKRLDEAGQPTPKVLKLGSLRSICRELDLSESGHNCEDIKRALAQNAGATINARISYKDREGRVRRLEAVFSRYSVVFTGETLPDGTEADGVYLVMNDIYQGFLNQVPLRPLDYNYIRRLTPSASRFYEVVSFPIMAALKYGWPRASMKYSEYCEATGQRRHLNGKDVSKQMYKLHKPHLDSGYLARVELEKFSDEGDQPDWNIWYTPGPRARDEYGRFSTAQGKPVPALEADGGLISKKPSPAEELVNHFLLERFGQARRRTAEKELRLAEKLIGAAGLEKAKKVVSDAVTRAAKAGLRPLWMTGIERFLRESGGRERAETGPRRAGRGGKSPVAAGAEELYEQMLPLERMGRQQRALAKLKTQVAPDVLDDQATRDRLIRSAIIRDLMREIEGEE
jgi:hypothetical protein